MQANAPIWISAGEASGDIHAARLLKALRERDPELRALGMGGPELQAAGCEVRFPMRLISLVGFTEVFGGLPRIVRLLRQVRTTLAAERPRALILTDCPDFHFRVAKMAKRLGIPVYYYISPQVWAWRAGRVKFLRKYARRVLCILPFEEKFYADRGADVARYVGHPLLDELPLAELDGIEPEPDLLGLLPGSRRKEIAALLPEFIRTARLLRKARPGLRVLLARAPGVDHRFLQRFLPADVPIRIVPPEDRHELMRRARALLAASGTATLESALIGTPTVVAYRLSGLTFALGRAAVKVKWVCLANIIMGREVLPELLQKRATAAEFFRKLAPLFLEDAAWNAARAELAPLRAKLGGPGAAARAAEIILSDLAALAKSV